jgi:hypothetical protein
MDEKMLFKNNQIWGINAQNTKFRFSLLLIMCEFFQNDFFKELPQGHRISSSTDLAAVL